MNLPREVVPLLQELVRIPSVNPDGDPGTARTGEAECAGFVADFLKECGAAVEFQEVHPGRPNVIGRFGTGGVGSKPRLVLAPHLDTVSVRGMTIDPFAGELREGRVWGRGASDTKGSVAGMLMALFEMKDRLASLEHEIWFAGLMGEEAGQDGSRAFVQEHRADFAVIGEPTELQIVRTHKGGLWMTLTTRGVAAHASTPELGGNAIYRMHDVIALLREEILPELSQYRDETLGHPTLNIGTIAGGNKVNIVPDTCRVGLDIRTVPAMARNDFKGKLTRRLHSSFPDLEIEAWESNALDTPAEHPMIARLEKTGARCTGAPWFCDAAIFSGANIAAVALGPGSIRQAHTKDEWIAVESLRQGVKFYTRFLELC